MAAIAADGISKRRSIKPVDAKIPATISSESPGKKNPKKSPVSMNIMTAIPGTPAKLIQYSGLRKSWEDENETVRN